MIKSFSVYLYEFDFISMKQLYTLLVAVLICTNLNAQFFGPKKILGNRNLKTESRNLQAYDKINVSNQYNVELYNGKEGHIKVEAEENLLEYIETYVKDGTLYIETKNRVRIIPSIRKKILVKVPVEDIDNVSLLGSGNIYSTGIINCTTMSMGISGSGHIQLELSSSTVIADISGSGNITLDGQSSNLEVEITGSGYINSTKLEAHKVRAKITGSGSIKLRVLHELNAEITGSGSISYIGEPAILSKEITGSGKILKK